ncbi:hypothetical protein M885DRAFT_547040 [Pelagophyceae sp. CCMP2097]|nr:hypothetical protein M885DRAFT_547040 [Pelagophyceae sp. CCMP2097]
MDTRSSSPGTPVVLRVVLEPDASSSASSAATKAAPSERTRVTATNGEALPKTLFVDENVFTSHFRLPPQLRARVKIFAGADSPACASPDVARLPSRQFEPPVARSASPTSCLDVQLARLDCPDEQSCTSTISRSRAQSVDHAHASVRDCEVVHVRLTEAALRLHNEAVVRRFLAPSAANHASATNAATTE